MSVGGVMYPLPSLGTAVNPALPSPSASTVMFPIIVSPVYEAGQAAMGSVMVRPTSATVWSIFNVLAGSQPDSVPALGNLGMVGASHTEAGTLIDTLRPRAMKPPRAVNWNSGRTVPHDQVLPASMVPVAANLARFHR